MREKKEQKQMYKVQVNLLSHPHSNRMFRYPSSFLYKATKGVLTQSSPRWAISHTCRLRVCVYRETS